MTTTQAAGIVSPRVSELIRELEEDYEEKIAELTEKLAAATAEIHQLKVDRELDVILRTRDVQEQLAQAYGENIELLRNYEQACARRDEAEAERNLLRSENAQLKSRDLRLTAAAERLAAEKGAAETERDAALYKVSQLEADAEEDRCLLPERHVCQRCGGSRTEYRRGDGYYCHRCEDVYEPFRRHEA